MDSLLCVYVVSCAASKPTFVSEVVFFSFNVHPTEVISKIDKREKPLKNCIIPILFLVAYKCVNAW